MRKFSLGLSAAFLLAFPAFAAAQNPMTGDSIGQYMWVVFLLLGVSLAVIIVLAITSGKKK